MVFEELIPVESLRLWKGCSECWELNIIEIVFQTGPSKLQN